MNIIEMEIAVIDAKIRELRENNGSKTEIDKLIARRDQLFMIA